MPNAREHRLRPEPQRARLAGMPGVARLAHHLQIVDRRARRGEQRQRLGLGVERVERRAPCRRASRARARSPASTSAERRRARRRRDSAGRSRTAARCRAPRFRLRAAAASRPGSSDGRITFSSSLIGLASVQAPPPNGAASRLGHEAPRHRLVEPARGGGAADAALELLLGRGGRPGDAGQRAAAASRAPCRSPRCGSPPRPGRRGRRRRAASVGTRDRPALDRREQRVEGVGVVDRDREAERRRIAPALDARAPPSVAARCGIVGDDVRGSTGGVPARVTAARRAAAQVEHQPRRDREPVVEERRIDAALEPLARVAGQRQLLAGARDARRDRNRRIRSARRWSSPTRPNARRP